MQAYRVTFQLGGAPAEAVVITSESSASEVDHAVRARVISAFLAHFFPARPHRVLVLGVSAMGPVAIHPADRRVLAEALLSDPHIHPVDFSG